MLGNPCSVVPIMVATMLSRNIGTLGALVGVSGECKIDRSNALVGYQEWGCAVQNPGRGQDYWHP